MTPSLNASIADETRVSFTVHEHSTGAEFRFVMPGPHPGHSNESSTDRAVRAQQAGRSAS